MHPPHRPLQMPLTPSTSVSAPALPMSSCSKIARSSRPSTTSSTPSSPSSSRRRSSSRTNRSRNPQSKSPPPRHPSLHNPSRLHNSNVQAVPIVEPSTRLSGDATPRARPSAMLAVSRLYPFSSHLLSFPPPSPSRVNAWHGLGRGRPFRPDTFHASRSMYIVMLRCGYICTACSRHVDSDMITIGPHSFFLRSCSTYRFVSAVAVC